MAISLPLRKDSCPDFLMMNEDGATFVCDNISVKTFERYLGTKSVNFRHVWFKGVKFLLASDRDQSTEKWKRRAYLSYGPDPANGSLLYGKLLLFGWDSDGERIRSLSDIEMDVLWECVKCLSVNYGTPEKKNVETLFRLCGAEDRPTKDTPFIIEGDVEPTE